MTQQKPIRISGQLASIYVAMIWGVRIMLILPIILPLFIEPENGQKIEPQVIVLVAVPWLLFETWRWIAWCRTLWLIDKSTGFIIKSCFRSNEYDDDDVLMTSLSFRFVQPQIASETYHRRTYHLWLRQRKITMRSLIKQTDTHDPLVPFITRIEEKRLQKAKAELELGGEIAGTDRWSLTETTLTVKDRAMGEQAYSISELVAVKLCVDYVAVWNREAVLPILKAPVSSPNAPLLLVLLAEKLVSQESPVSWGNIDGSLGHEIFTSRRGQKIGIHLAVIALIAWFCFVRRAEPDVVAVIGVFSIFYVIIGLLPAVARLVSPRFEIYENGVMRRGMFGNTTIFFDRMIGYTFTKDVMYYNHILCMSDVVIRIQWQDEADKIRSTTWRCRGRNLSHEFAEYDFFAEDLTEVFVRKMWDELHTANITYWNDAVQIARDGVHLTSSKGKAKKLGTVFVPFDQLHYTIDENGATFSTEKIRIFVPKNALNYLPGIQFMFEVAAAQRVG